ncbi:MAG: TonB-dependent receptor, partial [Alphaproteobacteria bacterium]
VTLRGEYQEVLDEQPGSLTSEEFEENWRQAMVKDAYSDESYATISGSLEHQFSEMSNAKIAYSGRKSTNEGPTALSYKSGYVDEVSIDHSLLAQYQQKFGYLSSKLVVGTDLQYSDNREKSYVWDTGDAEHGPLNKDWNLLAITGAPFAQLQFSPVKWAEVTLGGRYDYINYTGTDKFGDKGELEAEFQNLSKKAGVSFAVNDKTTLWFGYGEAFVAPSRTYLFSSTASYSNYTHNYSGYNADPNLDPETAKNYSVGLRGTLAKGVFGYDVSLYHTDIKDMVVGVDRGGGLDGRVYVNAGNIRGQGLETSFYVKPNDMLRFDAGYTYAINKYTDFVDGDNDYTGNYVVSSPLHHLNARVTVTPIKNLDIELEWDHISEFYTSNANDDPNGQYQRPDLWHLKVNYEDGPWEYWGQARNLTDVKYADSVSYSARNHDRSYGPGNGRTFMAGARYKF